MDALDRIRPALVYLAGRVNEGLVASVVCLPVCLYYLTLLTLTRSNMKVCSLDLPPPSPLDLYYQYKLPECMRPTPMSGPGSCLGDSRRGGICLHLLPHAGKVCVEPRVIRHIHDAAEKPDMLNTQIEDSV